MKWTDKLKVTVLVERNPDDTLSAFVVENGARGPNLVKSKTRDLETAKGRAYAAIKREFPNMSLEVKWHVIGRDPIGNQRPGPRWVKP